MGSFELPASFSVNPLLRVYTIENARAGERMARYLCSLGHRSVAYISSMHHAPWLKKGLMVRMRILPALITEKDCI